MHWYGKCAFLEGVGVSQTNDLSKNQFGIVDCDVKNYN